MRPTVALTLVLIATTAGLIFWILQTDSPQPLADQPAIQPGPGPEASPVAAPADRPSRPAAEPAAVPAPVAQLPPLDCAAPQGPAFRINRAEVSVADFCTALVGLAGPRPEPTTGTWQQQARDLRDRLIDAELVHRALAAEGEAVADAEVEAELGARLATAAGAGSAELSQATRQAIAAQLRARMELARLVEHRAPAPISEADLHAEWQQAPGTFGEPRSATVVAYLARLITHAPEELWAKERLKAQRFADGIAAGKGPAEAAAAAGVIAMPRTELKEGGGEVALTEAALRLTPGQWTAPVRTAVGWVVLHVEQVKPGQVLPLDKVRDKVRTQVLAKRKLQAQQRVLAELRSAAQIVELVSLEDPPAPAHPGPPSLP